MNKEECIDGCIMNLEFQIKNCEDYGHSDVYLDVYDAKNLLSIIKEHFELEKRCERLEKANEKQANIIRESILTKKPCAWFIDEIRSYKFEDLKPNMWIWDERLKWCFQVCENDIKPKYLRKWCFKVRNRDGSTSLINFEENRFFPVQKANEVIDDE